MNTAGKGRKVWEAELGGRLARLVVLGVGVVPLSEALMEVLRGHGVAICNGL